MRKRVSGKRVSGVVAVVVVVWLVVGIIAAVQRGYFKGSAVNCAKTATVAVTVLAGPLNYAGVNPKITCQVPQPSK